MVRWPNTTFWPDRPRTRSEWVRFVVLDLGTVVVSVSDIVTDVTVILNYWRMGYYGFAYLSFAVLCLSSFVFSITYVGVFAQDRYSVFSDLKAHLPSRALNLLLHGLAAVVLTPIGQVFPVVIWALETFWPVSKNQVVVADTPSTAIEHGRLVLLRPVTDAELVALADEYELTMEDEILLRKRNFQLRWGDGDPLREYLKAQAMRHAPFVGEAITESVPQSLIQVVALIVIGQAHPNHVDWVSVVSILLSIVSIVSKSYIVSISMVRSIFRFKMIAICFDVVTLFFVFASLFLATEDTPHTLPLPLLDRRVDVLSFVWLAQLVLFTGWLYFVWLVIGVDTYVTSALDRLLAHRDRVTVGEVADALFVAVGLLIIGTAMWLPLMVVLCAANVSFVVVVLKNLEEVFPEEMYPFYNQVLRLLQGPDFKTKLQAYNLVAIAAEYGGSQAYLGPDKGNFMRTSQDALAVCDAERLSLREFRRATDKNTSFSAMLAEFNKDTRNFAQDQQSKHLSDVCPGCTWLLDRVIRPVRLLALRGSIILTVTLYLGLSLSTLLFPPTSFALAVHDRYFHDGGGPTALDGVYTFQLILFMASLALFICILRDSFTVLPWYFRALNHMVPVRRTNLTVVSKALGMKPEDLGKNHNIHSTINIDAVMDFMFKRVVAVYSARSGRSEADVWCEVHANAESADTTATAHCMECLHLLGRAA